MFARYKIWKLQRPLMTSEDVPMVMAYTEEKEDMAMIPMPEEYIDELFGDELKVYVRANVKNGVLNIKNRVEEPDW